MTSTTQPMTSTTQPMTSMLSTTQPMTTTTRTVVYQPTTTPLNYLLNKCIDNTVIGGYDNNEYVLFELNDTCNEPPQQSYVNNVNVDNVNVDNSNKMRYDLTNLNNENNTENKYQNVIEGFENKKKKKVKKCKNNKMKWLEDNFYCLLSILVLILMFVYREDIMKWLNE